MRIRLHGWVAVAFAMLFASCNVTPSRPSVDVAIVNDSSNRLNWVSVHWDEGEQSAGIMSPGVSKVFLDAGLPKAPRSDKAFIEFVDENDGWTYQDRPNSERKHYRIPIDVSALKQLSSGHYEVTFSIRSFTEARLTIEKKEE